MKQLQVIRQLEQLQKLDISRIYQCLEYSQQLEWDEIKMALRLQNQQQLRSSLKALEAKYALKNEQLAAKNLELLEQWQAKQQEYVSIFEKNLQQFLLTIGEIFAFSSQRVDAILAEIIKNLRAENLYEEAQAQERNLKIKVSFNDSIQLKETLAELSGPDQDLNYAWLLKYLVIEHELSDGWAIMEDKFSIIYISLATAEKKIIEVFKQLFKRE